MTDPEETHSLIEKYWESVPPAWHQTRATIRRVAAEEFNLTVEQFQVLRRIRRGITSVSTLADTSQTSRSAVSKAVDSLVHKGLTKRNQDPDDRRNIPLELTDEGHRIMTAIYQKTERWLADKFSSLREDEILLLLRGMDILQKIFPQ